MQPQRPQPHIKALWDSAGASSSVGPEVLYDRYLYSYIYIYVFICLFNYTRIYIYIYMYIYKHNICMFR